MATPRALRRLMVANPARPVVALFAAAIAAGTGLLALPWASASGRSVGLVDALFTATSAVCVTGLTVLDTATAWSPFGKAVILLLVQAGGLGIVTLATVVALVINRRMRLATALVAQAERPVVSLGELRQLLRSVLTFFVAFEAAGALLLTVRFSMTTDEGPAQAVWLGTFHAVSAFNNAGFSLFDASLAPFRADVVVNGVVIVLVVAGGIGFPVLAEILRSPRVRRRITLHTRVTLAATGVLLVGGFAAVALLEWANPATLGPLSVAEKSLASAFAAVQPRTAGFATLDVAAMRPETWLVTAMLMFVGGGSASTAGGIKVSTFALIALVIRAELRGQPDVTAFGRRLGSGVQRQAVALVTLALSAVVLGGLLIVARAPIPLDRALFESTSAFGTVGLSAGVTETLRAPERLFLVLLMFLGRLGPLTFGAALVLRRRDIRFRYPEERPIIG